MVRKPSAPTCLFTCSNGKIEREKVCGKMVGKKYVKKCVECSLKRSRRSLFREASLQGVFAQSFLESLTKEAIVLFILDQASIFILRKKHCVLGEIIFRIKQQFLEGLRYYSSPVSLLCFHANCITSRYKIYRRHLPAMYMIFSLHFGEQGSSTLMLHHFFQIADASVIH